MCCSWNPISMECFTQSIRIIVCSELKFHSPLPLKYISHFLISAKSKRNRSWSLRIPISIPNPMTNIFRSCNLGVERCQANQFTLKSSEYIAAVEFHMILGAKQVSFGVFPIRNITLTTYRTSKSFDLLSAGAIFSH